MSDGPVLPLLISGCWSLNTNCSGEFSGTNPFIKYIDDIRDDVIKFGHQGVGIRVYLVKKE